MRIKEINIKGLFGMFNHSIPLNLEDNLTIIYGINGIGKTMIFKILDYFLNENYYQLVKIPFSEVRIILDDNSSFKLLNFDDKFIVEYYTKNKSLKKINLSLFKSLKKDKYFIETLEKEFSWVKTSDNMYRNYDTYNELSFDELLQTLPIDYLNLVFKTSNIKEIGILRDITSSLELYFIKTQRLISFNYYSGEKNYLTRDSKWLNYKIRKRPFGNIKKDTIKNYSNELAEMIQDKHFEYAKLSEKLELSLGKRLMSREVETISNINDLKKENKSLEEKREKFNIVGLFKNENEDSFTIPNDIDELTRAVLSVNIQDMKIKLEIFDELYNKLNTFLDILNNKRLSYKKISVHPEEGFIFKNDEGKSLKATELSSGEQHEIVMLFDLIFKVPESSLVLIDEPEISLHIGWQMEFLEDMLDIVKLGKFDILIATHSPSIINGNWDLTVELSKENKE